MNSKIQPLETIIVEKRQVSCNGGTGALGHPMIYLTIPESGQIDCPYCGKRFMMDKGGI